MADLIWSHKSAFRRLFVQEIADGDTFLVDARGQRCVAHASAPASADGCPPPEACVHMDNKEHNEHLVLALLQPKPIFAGSHARRCNININVPLRSMLCGIEQSPGHLPHLLRG